MRQHIGLISNKRGRLHQVIYMNCLPRHVKVQALQVRGPNKILLLAFSCVMRQAL